MQFHIPTGETRDAVITTMRLQAWIGLELLWSCFNVKNRGLPGF
jgi:hypothetical protein